MGVRYRKSISMGKGMRLNITKTGLGMSVGTKGLRYSVHSSGRTTATAGIPGTGLSYTASRSTRSSAAAKRQIPSPPSSSSPALLKASLFAPKYEKAFVKGLKLAMVENYAAALPLFEEASTAAGPAVISPTFWAGYCHLRLEHERDAAGYLEKVVASDVALPDALMYKHRISAAVELTVTPGLKATVPFSTAGAGLILAELYQDFGEMEKAIGMLEAIAEAAGSDLVITASLAELYTMHDDWDDAIEITNGVRNTDDVSCQTLILRARALSAKGLNEGALEALKEAMRSKKRSFELLKAARYERAGVYERLGKRSQARKDLERLYAEDSAYADVAERLT